ncbi:MAG: ligand-binding sensor domain-containing protein [Putridiphycobacter sp.]
MIKFSITTTLLLIFNFSVAQLSNDDLNPFLNSEQNKQDSLTKTIHSENSLVFLVSDNQISPVVRTMFQDSKGNLWFGTQSGAFKLVGDSLLVHIDKITGVSGNGATIKQITEGIDGKIWLGHTDGISCVDGENVTNYYESDGLINNDVWTIAADKSGNIWIGTTGGISIFNGQTFSSFSLPNGEVDSTLGVSSKTMIHSIFEDSHGTIWLSSNAGLFSYANDTLVNVSKKVGIETNFVNEIYEDNTGVFWVSTKMGLYRLVDHKAKNITQGQIELGKGIGSIAKDKDDKLWFVINQHHVYTYNGSEFKEFKKPISDKGLVVFQIFKDQDNRLWFIGYGGAYRLENGNLINVTKNGPW